MSIESEQKIFVPVGRDKKTGKIIFEESLTVPLEEIENALTGYSDELLSRREALKRLAGLAAMAGGASVLAYFSGQGRHKNQGIINYGIEDQENEDSINFGPEGLTFEESVADKVPTAIDDELDFKIIEESGDIFDGQIRESLDFRAEVIKNVNWDGGSREALRNVVQNKIFYPPAQYYKLRNIAYGKDGSRSRHSMHGYYHYPDQLLFWWGQDLVLVGSRNEKGKIVRSKNVHAAFDGYVSNRGTEGNFGDWIDITSPNGFWRVRYHHVVRRLPKGKQVEAGEVVAREDPKRYHIHTVALWQTRGPGKPSGYKVVPLTEVVSVGPFRNYRTGHANQILLPDRYFRFIDEVKNS